MQFQYDSTISYQKENFNQLIAAFKNGPESVAIIIETFKIISFLVVIVILYPYS